MLQIHWRLLFDEKKYSKVSALGCICTQQAIWKFAIKSCINELRNKRVQTFLNRTRPRRIKTWKSIYPRNYVQFETLYGILALFKSYVGMNTNFGYWAAKMCRVEPIFGLLSKWKKNWQSLIKDEISLSKNIKENVTKFGILLTLSQLHLRLQNVTASIYKLSIHSVHPVA